MIYYITSEKNQSIFDFMSSESDEIVNKNIRDNLILDVFAKNEMRNMKSIQYFALDVQALKLSGVQELKRTIDSFHILNPNSKIIIVANDPVIETELLFNIQKNCRSAHNITENNVEKQKEQIRSIYKKENEKVKETEKNQKELI